MKIDNEITNNINKLEIMVNNIIEEESKSKELAILKIKYLEKILTENLNKLSELRNRLFDQYKGDKETLIKQYEELK